jgi:hypothetical protein
MFLAARTPSGQTAGIGGDLPAIKVGENFAASMRLKEKRLCVALCHDETSANACCELLDNGILRKFSRLVYHAL